jgi:hypothetical protein
MRNKQTNKVVHIVVTFCTVNYKLKIEIKSQFLTIFIIFLFLHFHSINTIIILK